MIETYYGPQGLGLGILIDQMGTYLVLSTVGLLVAALYGHGAGISARSVIRRLLTFAPFVALVVALLLIPVAYPAWFDALLRRLGRRSCLWRSSPSATKFNGAPLAKLRELGMGLGFKLVAGPAVVALLFAGLFGARGETIQITIFEAAMAPQIGAAIVAVDHDLDPALVR
jgi:predicted permease